MPQYPGAQCPGAQCPEGGLRYPVIPWRGMQAWSAGNWRPTDGSTSMTTATYHVTGMTCEHCARAVTVELQALSGVGEVTVDLVPGGASAVTVVSAAPVSISDIEAALDEAGEYRIAAPGDAAGPGAGPGQSSLLPVIS